VIQPELESRWSDKIEKTKGAVKINAQISTKNWMAVLSWLCILPLTLIFRALIIPVTKKWSAIEPLAWIITLFFSIIINLLGIKLFMQKLRSHIETSIFNVIYKRKLNEFNSLFEKIAKDID
jgi:hypothetical protein